MLFVFIHITIFIIVYTRKTFLVFSLIFSYHLNIFALNSLNDGTTFACLFGFLFDRLKLITMSYVDYKKNC